MSKSKSKISQNEEEIATTADDFVKIAQLFLSKCLK